MPQSQHENNVTAMVAKPTSSYVHVTPDIAARWLLSNSTNRNLRAAKVDQYSRDMAHGRWTVSNDDICFDPEGRLLNGQHRLSAVIKSGVTILFGIKRNVPREAMSNMDSGAIRAAADVLTMRGERNTALLASTIKQAILIESGRVYQDNKVQGVSRGEIADFLEANPAIRDSVAASVNVKDRIDSPPTALATTHWLISHVNDRSLVDHYLTQLARRVGEGEGSAILAVDSRLREIRRHRQAYPTRNHVYLLLKGWNYYATGRPVQKLQMSPKAGTEFRLPIPARWSR